MRKHALAFSLFRSPFRRVRRPPRADEPRNAFVNVTVIPMDREGVLPDQTVIVRDGKIVGSPAARTKALTGTTTVDGKGKFLPPALRRCTRTSPAVRRRTRSSGGRCTSMPRTASARSRHARRSRHLTYRRARGEREIVSPRIYTRPSLNGNSVPTKEAAIAAVTAQKAADTTC